MLPRVGNLLPRPCDSSEFTDYYFLRFTATTSTPTSVSLSSLCSNWNDHPALNINLKIGNPKYVCRQTRNINNNYKTWLGFFLLYLRQNIKPYTSNELGLSWKILQKNNLHELWSIESNFRSIEPCRKSIVISCNYSIPTLHTNTLSKSKARLNILIMVCQHYIMKF